MSEQVKTNEDERMEKIRRRAHAIWLDQGMAHGRDEEHWHEAEREIAAEEAQAKKPSVEESAGAKPSKTK